LKTWRIKQYKISPCLLELLGFRDLCSRRQI
jgi:hypothetical protein